MKRRRGEIGYNERLINRMGVEINTETGAEDIEVETRRDEREMSCTIELEEDIGKLDQLRWYIKNYTGSRHHSKYSFKTHVLLDHSIQKLKQFGNLRTTSSSPFEKNHRLLSINYSQYSTSVEDLAKKFLLKRALDAVTSSHNTAFIQIAPDVNARENYKIIDEAVLSRLKAKLTLEMEGLQLWKRIIFKGTVLSSENWIRKSKTSGSAISVRNGEEFTFVNVEFFFTCTNRAFMFAVPFETQNPLDDLYNMGFNMHLDPEVLDLMYAYNGGRRPQLHATNRVSPYPIISTPVSRFSNPGTSQSIPAFQRNRSVVPPLTQAANLSSAYPDVAIRSNTVFLSESEYLFMDSVDPNLPLLANLKSTFSTDNMDIGKIGLVLYKYTLANLLDKPSYDECVNNLSLYSIHLPSNASCLGELSPKIFQLGQTFMMNINSKRYSDSNVTSKTPGPIVLIPTFEHVTRLFKGEYPFQAEVFVSLYHLRKPPNDIQRCITFVLKNSFAQIIACLLSVIRSVSVTPGILSINFPSRVQRTSFTSAPISFSNFYSVRFRFSKQLGVSTEERTKKFMILVKDASTMHTIITEKLQRLLSTIRKEVLHTDAIPVGEETVFINRFVAPGKMPPPVASSDETNALQTPEN